MSAHDKLQKGIKCFDNKNFLESIPFFNKVLDRDSGNIEALLYKSDAFLKKLKALVYLAFKLTVLMFSKFLRLPRKLLIVLAMVADQLLLRHPFIVGEVMVVLGMTVQQATEI